MIQTARNIKIAPAAPRFYEALPDEYATSDKKYPLIIFMHGVGECINPEGKPTNNPLTVVLKNGIPKLINNKTFPESFGEAQQKFIVVSPQFLSGPTNASVDAIIDYCAKNYRIDTNRIYLTGLSLGGGGVENYLQTASLSKLAAAVVVCGANTLTAAGGKLVASTKLPVWFLVNSGDPYGFAAKTKTSVANITAAKPTIEPKLTVFTASGHDAWSKAYDPAYKENGKNVYEWMLQYTADRNNVPVVVEPPREPVQLSVNIARLSGLIATEPWNDWDLLGLTGTVTKNDLKNSNKTDSKVTISLTNVEGTVDSGPNYGVGFEPKQIIRTGIYSTQEVVLTIKGLNPVKFYDIELYASRSAKPNENTVFTIGTVSKTIPTNYNVDQIAKFENQAISASGDLVVKLNHTRQFVFFNGFKLTEK